MAARTLVFVYGSLLKGLRNHSRLTQHGAIEIGPAVLSGSYTMISLGAFPGVVDGGTTDIRGEVYAVTSAGLADLDRLEGHPDFYRRTSVAVTLDADVRDGAGGTSTAVETYILQGHWSDRGLGDVGSGCWRTHIGQPVSGPQTLPRRTVVRSASIGLSADGGTNGPESSTRRRRKSKSKTVLYFAFGSNMDEAQMARRCPGATCIGPATLPGYRLSFTGWSGGWGGAVATVEEHSGSTVQGLVYRLSAKDIKDLDAYEGAPTVYVRRRMSVATPSGVGKAHVYVKRNDTAVGRPSAEYVTAIRSGYEAFDLDPSTLDEAVARCDVDPPVRKRGRKGFSVRLVDTKGRNRCLGCGSVVKKSVCRKCRKADQRVPRMRAETLDWIRSLND